MATRDPEHVLAEMRAQDAERADLAEAAWEWMTGGGGLEAISLAVVQRFAWFDVLVKWLDGPYAAAQILDATAELLDRIGLSRYADVCRGEDATAIAQALTVSADDAAKAYDKALDRSGMAVPDLDDFTWGGIMRGVESDALQAVEHALEAALEAGRFTPGRRGWRTESRTVTADCLDTEHPNLPGQTWRTLVLTERIENWANASAHRSPDLAALRSRHANKLLHPIATPTDVAARVEPVTWFLDRVEDAKLTQAGYLPTVMVREAHERFGWTTVPFGRDPTSESEMGPLLDMHETLLHSGAVYRRHGRVHVSKTGAALRDDPEAAWRWMAIHTTDHPWIRAATEVWALMSLDGPQDTEPLVKEVARHLESSWRVGGVPPDPRDAYHAYGPMRRLLDTWGALSEHGQWPDETETIDEFGRATLLEFLRSIATGPIDGHW